MLKTDHNNNFLKAIDIAKYCCNLLHNNQLEVFGAYTGKRTDLISLTGSNLIERFTSATM